MPNVSRIRAHNFAAKKSKLLSIKSKLEKARKVNSRKVEYLQKRLEDLRSQKQVIEEEKTRILLRLSSKESRLSSLRIEKEKTLIEIKDLCSCDPSFTVRINDAIQKCSTLLTKTKEQETKYFGLEVPPRGHFMLHEIFSGFFDRVSCFGINYALTVMCRRAALGR